jgi:hypothetical protein
MFMNLVLRTTCPKLSMFSHRRSIYHVIFPIRSYSFPKEV